MRTHREDVVGDAREVHGGDALAHPLRVHLAGVVPPHLAVVGHEEEVQDALPEALLEPLEEVLGLGDDARGALLLLQRDEPLHALLQVLLGEPARLIV